MYEPYPNCLSRNHYGLKVKYIVLIINIALLFFQKTIYFIFCIYDVLYKNISIFYFINIYMNEYIIYHFLRSIQPPG